MQITIPGGNGFDRTIPVFKVGEVYEIDLFVKFTGAGYASGQAVCNEATAYGPTGTAELVANDNRANACLTYQDCSPTQQCAAELYAKDFVIDKNADKVTIGATCVSEGTCGYSNSFPAIPACIQYGTQTITINPGQPVTIVLKDQSSCTPINGQSITPNLIACGSDLACIAAAFNAAIDPIDSTDGFDNYDAFTANDFSCKV